MSILNKILGSSNSRKLKKMNRTVAVINSLEESLESLTDEELREKTGEFKQRIEEGVSLDDILPEAFAAVRESSKRTLGLRHFDVQMVGGMVLHQGNISEMRTGEGKTLVATLPAYLNGLSGKGVHVVTVNEYLAQRDADWMRPIFELLGFSVGTIKSGQTPEEKKAGYDSDITYGTNNEFGFDYLRDNMAFRLDQKMQRKLNFAIVDEVDSILIDEARTPLIISGAAEGSSQLYVAIDKLIPRLDKGVKAEKSKMEMMDKNYLPEDTGHFSVDEKSRQVELTEEGHEYVEDLLIQKKLLNEGESLYAATNLSLLHHVHAGLKAHNLFNKDIEYIVQNRQIVLIDEHTGRTMEGRRLSEGLHQALEAKEGLEIQSESQTLASTTFQNYFRIYNTLSGMTGTADTEAFEFSQIYGLDVIVIPTNVPMIRNDANDLIYLSMEEKMEAIVRDIIEIRDSGAPILVGTASIDTSETLSQFLKKNKIDHEVLNAKFHEKEAQIIAQAGRPGAVTIATNMAGRGTDIVLGGKWEAEIAEITNPSDDRLQQIKGDWQKRHDQVIEAGGLHIIGTERHESRRIDNQLRGRSGRQGDPGYSRFYLSMEDNLLRIFATDGVKNFMRRLGMEQGEAIEHGMVTRSIEKAQRKVEGRNFDVRKQLLEYDNVANDQRTIIYRQRNELMASDDITDLLEGMRSEVVDALVDNYIPPQSVPEQWDISGLEQSIETEFGSEKPIQKWLDEDDQLYEEQLKAKITALLTEEYLQKCDLVGAKMREFEKQITLQILDRLWKEHLATMDHLRQGIFLRSYGGKNPRQEYKREAFAQFTELMLALQQEVIKVLSHIQIKQDEAADTIERQREEESARAGMNYQHQTMSALANTEGGEGKEPSQEPRGGNKQSPFVREIAKVGRNDPCPCGSGKKYKQCCGKLG
ncbi:preprotein translocase subunit SecA [Gammaproteobacteria bacterium]|uniref:Protein translocase subunit SecA n=1 Tax=OM182 bacterium MED-G28 TaxID=1986256 RepID=A0A2A5W9V8_9GAMM|nr:preprotein translocase subunit SecA [Gammaproteobacteria bacterium]PDH33078.1 MAG: preprotein translocase subunit SecA [OM182 bacterium MED-G28]